MTPTNPTTQTITPQNMFVYGIRCPVTMLPQLASAFPVDQPDYYMEYGLLVFPAYTKPTCLRSYNNQMTPQYVETCRRIIECIPTEAVEIDLLEHPFITEEEDEAVWRVKEASPEYDVGWFHVPTCKL